MTVIARRILARPVRTSTQTWEVITDILCHSNTNIKSDFNVVSGVAASLISEETFREYPLILKGEGARIRVYCLYDDEAVSGEEKNEDTISWDPFKKEWLAYLPCAKDDLDWCTKEISKLSKHFSVYEDKVGIDEEDVNQNESKSLTIDKEVFKKI